MKSKPSPLLRRIDHGVYQATKIFSWLSGGAVIAIMLLAAVDVVCSKFFNAAVPSATEWITHLNIVVVLPTLAYIQLDTGHINVELFSGMNRTVKMIVRVFGNLLGLGCSALLGHYSLKLMSAYLAKGVMSSTSAMTKGLFHLWPFVAVFALGMIFFFLSIVWSFVREFSGLELVNNPIDMGPYKDGEDEKEAES